MTILILLMRSASRMSFPPRMTTKERSDDVVSPELSAEQYQREIAAIRKMLEVKVKDDEAHRVETS